MPSPSRAEGRWAEIRAAILGIVVFIASLQALPLPRKIDSKRYMDLAKEELDLWVDLFGSVGIETTPKALIELTNSAAAATYERKKELLAPIRPFFQLTGTGQAWGLFAFPDRFPDRLQVEGRAGIGAWDLLFRALDPEYDLMGSAIQFRRIRGVYDGAASRKTAGADYGRFADWVARGVFSARPDLDQVRLRLIHFRTPLPTDTDEFPETIRHERVRKRAEVMP